jgi:4-carboxymuconolactone decarboxylase
MSLEELHQNGLRTFAALVPDGEQRLADIFRVAPDLAELAVGTVYGHLHHRAALDSRTREAVTLGAIVACGMTGTPLSVHLRTGLAAGLAPAEIVEILLQAAAFSGFPRAVAALPMVERIFQDAGIPVPVPRSPRQAALDVLARRQETHDTPPEGSVPSSHGIQPPTGDAHVEVHALNADTALALLVRDDATEQPVTVLYVRCRDGQPVETRWLTAATDR